jgi:hypothetical protein
MEQHEAETGNARNTNDEKANFYFLRQAKTAECGLNSQEQA